jgi:hypothetical protein
MRRRVYVLLLADLLAFAAIWEGVWALDFALMGGCTTYLPGYWQVPTDAGTCANLRYWSIFGASLWLTFRAISSTFREAVWGAIASE